MAALNQWASEVLARMRRTEHEEKNKRNPCPICLDALVLHPRVAQDRPPCQHTFHDECLKMWAQREGTCPTCQGILPREEGLWGEMHLPGAPDPTIRQAHDCLMEAIRGHGGVTYLLGWGRWKSVLEGNLHFRLQQISRCWRPMWPIRHNCRRCDKRFGQQ